MKAYRTPTLTALHTKMCEVMIHAPKAELDMVTAVDVQMHSVMVQADSMVWDWDIKDLWLTKARWTAMVRQYIDPVATQEWIGKITERIGRSGRGIALMRSNEIGIRGGANHPKQTRRWGSCMISYSFKAKPRPTLTMHSRTSYIGYIGVLDLTIAWNLARYVALEIGIPVEEISFIWTNEAQQWHYFKSLAYLLHHPDEEEREWYRHILSSPEIDSDDEQYIANFPALKGGRLWLQKLIKDDTAGKDYGHTTYNTYRRVRRRYHTEVLGLDYAKQFEGFYYPKRAKDNEPRFMAAYPVLPSVSVQALDFSTIGMPYGKTWGTEFLGEVDDDDDE